MAAAAEWAEANKKLEHSVDALQSDRDAETAARAEMESTVGDLQAQLAAQAAELQAQVAAAAKLADAKKKWVQRFGALQSELGTESSARSELEEMFEALKSQAQEEEERVAQEQREWSQRMADTTARAEAAEAERLREQQERMRLQAERDLLRGGNATMLSMQVDALLQGSWAKRSTYMMSRLLEVTEVTDPALTERFDAYTQRLTAEMGGEGSPEWDVTQLLFHG